MVIKSIQLSNFGCYKGEQQPIIFSTDPDRNVTVVLGANKSGKTTLVSAFIWCLYGDGNFKNGVINSEVKEALTPGASRTVMVEIVLVHSGKEWTIRRSQRFSRVNVRVTSDDAVLKVQYKEANGEQQSISSRRDCEEAINNILPHGLSDYFFYEGERFDDVSKKNVAAAVRGLMNLDAIAVARDRLDPSNRKSVTSYFRSKLVSDNTQEGENLKRKLEKAQNDREATIIRITQAKEEFEFYTQRKAELETQLSQYESVRKLQEKRKAIENDIAVGKRNIESAAKRIVSDFQKGTLAFFALPLISRAISSIENSNQDGEGIPEMRQAAIDHILGRNRCICGCDLNENEGARKRILAERNLLPPAHIGTLLYNIRQTLDGFSVSSNGYVENACENYKSWRENIRFVENKEKDFEQVGIEIDEVGSVDTTAIETDYKKTVAAIKDKEQLKDALIAERGRLDGEIDNLKTRIGSLVSNTEHNRKIQSYIDYAEALFEWFNASYTRREREVKEALTESVNRIFSAMYHGHRIVTIDDGYQIKLFAAVGASREEIADTGGLRAIKNFAYITGLVDIARQKVNNKGTGAEIESEDDAINETESYPLVMDAPFSATDETHINNISKIIPGIAEQVIIIVMQKDWAYAKSAIQNRIGKTYVIENVDNSETFSRIKEGE